MDINLSIYLKDVDLKEVFHNIKDGSVLIKIPAGVFIMGDDLEADCPKHQVYMDEYYLSAFAVTNRQYQKFIEETGHRPPDQAELGRAIWCHGSFPKKFADHPVVCVSYDDALAYCAWSGLALPTEAQWEKAARGPKGNIYPWGDNWDFEKCLNYMKKGFEQTCPVYENEDGKSFYHIYNCAGNILEWCADWYDPDYYASSPGKNPLGPERGEFRVLRGGSWGSGLNDCRGAFRGDYNRPVERADHWGFRPALNLASL
jgi:formylglycine-generating enzyme required for sulfatase activity